METTTPKTGFSGAASGTATMGRIGRTEANRAADAAHGTVDNVAQGAHDAVDRIAAKASPAIDRVRAAATDVQTYRVHKVRRFHQRRMGRELHAMKCAHGR